MPARILIWTMRFGFRQAAVFLFLLLNLPLAFWFFKTAYLSSRSFQIFCLAEALIAGGIALFAPRLRFLTAGFAIAALPRLASLLLQRELPNVLFPVFFGLALGSLRPARRPVTVSLREIWPAWLLACGLILASFLTFPVYYPGVTRDFALQDSIIAGHVSANFAIHLSLSFALAMLAPLAWILGESLEHPGEKEAREICAGLTAGFLLSVVVLLLQGRFDALWAGVTDHALEAGRRPGLFSDSGASNVLFPALCVIASFTLVPFSGKSSGSGFQKWKWLLVPAMTAVFLAWTSVYQGKAVFLSMAGIALVWRWLLPAKDRISLTGTLLVLAAAAVLVLLFIHIKAPAIAERLAASAGNPEAALAAVDPVRTMLLRAFYDIFRESPWVGHGLNSFVPQLMLLKASRPEVFPENPPGLIPGILNDTGLAGLLVLAWAAAGAALLLRARLKELQGETSVPLRLLVLLPVSLGPVFLVGYHILFAEISAFSVLPFLFLSAKPTSASTSSQP